MKRAQKIDERKQAPTAAPEAEEQTPGLQLRIEELEPRLTPQSSTSILD